MWLITSRHQISVTKNESLLNILFTLLTARRPRIRCITQSGSVVTQVLAAHADASLLPLPPARAVVRAEPLRGDARCAQPARWHLKAEEKPFQNLFNPCYFLNLPLLPLFEIAALQNDRFQKFRENTNRLFSTCRDSVQGWRQVQRRPPFAPSSTASWTWTCPRPLPTAS